MLWRLKESLTPSLGENMVEGRLWDKKLCLPWPASYLLPVFSHCGFELHSHIPPGEEQSPVSWSLSVCMQAWAGSWESASLPSSGELCVMWTPHSMQGPLRPAARASNSILNSSPVHLWAGCDAQQRDNHSVTGLSELSPQAIRNPGLHINPSTSSGKVPTHTSSWWSWQIKSYETVEVEMRV